MLSKIFIILLALMSFCLQATADEDNENSLEEAMAEPPDCYILPLSYDEDAPLLIIPIPEGFRLSYNGSSYPDVMYLQFVPCKENSTYWTEMITLCQTTETLDAHEFIRSFKSVMEEARVVESYSQYTSYIRCGSERGVKVGYYVSEHPSFDPHKIGITAPPCLELLKVKTIQADDRVWVIQYVVRYDPEETSYEEREALIDKVHEFFKRCKVSSNFAGSSA